MRKSLEKDDSNFEVDEDDNSVERNIEDGDENSEEDDDEEEEEEIVNDIERQRGK